MKTVLFSGRYDPVHIGHIDTITDLGRQYKVLVVVLDHPEQKYPVLERASRLNKILEKCRGEYRVMVNIDHFAWISAPRARSFCFDLYASGNEKCLRHMRKLGFNTLYIGRSGIESSSELRRIREM